MRICFVLLLFLCLSACSSFERKLAADVFTFEYVGTDCGRAEKDFSDLSTVKGWIDFEKLSLREIKAKTVTHIITGDYDPNQKRSMLAAVSFVELKINSDFELSVEENDIRLTVSEFVDYVIEAYSIACPSAV